MSRKVDPRPERTRALLREALIELIQEKRWDRIRVQDVLDRTGVGRSTFYAHYDNKFDLLTAGIPNTVFPISNANGEPDLLPLFEHVKEMRPVLLPIMSQPLLGEVMDAFQQGMVAAWVTHLEAIGVPPERQTVASEFLAGGFMATARQWLKNECVPEPGEICDEFEQYSKSVIAVSKGGQIPKSWRR